MHKLANNRWFPLIGLVITMTAGGVWLVTAGRMGWRPLVLALLPFIIRTGADRSSFNRTPFDGLLIVFVLTAVFGVWITYDQSLGMRKLWLLLGGVLIYYALTSVSRRDIWLVSALWGAAGAGVAVYSLAKQNFNAFPAEIGLLNRGGLWWMGVRPFLPGQSLHPNAAGGILAILFPMQLVFFRRFLRRKNRPLVWISTVVMGFTLFSLMMTSSRGAIGSLAVGLAIWGLWQKSRGLSHRLKRPHRLVFTGLLVGLVGLILIGVLGAGAVSGLDHLTGMDETTTRLELARQAVALAQDFPWTGSGLGSFPALYAQYIEVTPVFVLLYSNFYLDLLLEMGSIGLLVMLVILAGSGWLLAQPPHSHGRQKAYRARTAVDFRWAVFIGLLVVALQGLVDDPLYGGVGTPLLLALPGMAVFVTGRRGRRRAHPPGYWAANFRQRAGRYWHKRTRRQQTLMTAGWLASALLVVWVFWRPALSHWQSDLGALSMARAELVGWPTGQWDDGRSLALLGPAEQWFDSALAISPTNRTALHRLGLIAMLRRDYGTAAAYLEEAHRLDETHRGITKSLAYSIVWNGEPEKAAVMLADIEEAEREMRIYTGWWRDQSRPDLAAQANKALIILQE